MNILIIFAHPNERSYCAAIRKKFIAGLKTSNHKVKIHNLYKDNFNPLLSKEELKNKEETLKDPLVKKYRKDIDWADVIALIHPAYWYGVPAILKGYFDRLLEEGFAYDYVVDHPEPKLGNKKGILIQTFDAEEELEKKMFDDITFKSVYFTWKYCGIEKWIRKSFFRVNFVSEMKRVEWLEEIFNLGLKIAESSGDWIVFD